MKAYVVGGAVRDRLLGLPVADRDWVVVGATPERMLELGFTPVGKDFPVFLHPQTREEYALARTERKHGHGHTGFRVHADPGVTLEQDLLRRDFTINAMAEDAHGRLIDPWGGARDLEQRILRHVSPAFVEDPLRVLRAARFLARLAPLGFRLAEETLALMQRMVASGELATLPAERVWREIERGLVAPRPSAMLDTLRRCGALACLLPEVDALFGVEQRAEYHPEVDAGVHTAMVVDQCARLAPGDAAVAFAGLTHDLGKALTPPAIRPRHPGHEHAGLEPIARLCQRLGVPREHAELAAIACREHLNVHRLDTLRSETVLRLIERCDGFRRPQRIERLGWVCEADARGRLGLEERAYPQREELLRLLAAVRAVRAADLAIEGLDGPAIAARLRKARIDALDTARRRPGEP